MLSEKTINHPDFDGCANAANQAVMDAAKSLGFDAVQVSQFETHAGRVVDDLTTLLMRLRKEQRK